MCAMKTEEDEGRPVQCSYNYMHQEDLFFDQNSGFIFPDVSLPPDPYLLYPPSSHNIYGCNRPADLRIISEAMVRPAGITSGQDAKALAASKSHSEAERRRRERINNHFSKLRTILPSTTKTDKASVLSEVIHRVKELKRQTSVIAETSPFPTETDELTVLETSEEEGRFVIKASLCCEDRSDLLPDLIKTLKALRLRTLKAEFTTLAGRVKNVLFITGDQTHCLSSIEGALKAVMEKPGGDLGSVKRQRANNN